MDRKVKSFRLRVDLLDRLKGYASERGSTEVSVMEAALESFFDDSRRGVPDLPREEPSGNAVLPVNVTQQSRRASAPVPSLLGLRQAALDRRSS